MTVLSLKLLCWLFTRSPLLCLDRREHGVWSHAVTLSHGRCVLRAASSCSVRFNSFCLLLVMLRKHVRRDDECTGPECPIWLCVFSSTPCLFCPPLALVPSGARTEFCLSPLFGLFAVTLVVAAVVAAWVLQNPLCLFLQFPVKRLDTPPHKAHESWRCTSISSLLTLGLSP